MKTSLDWDCTVENEDGDQLFESSSPCDALQFACKLDVGTLEADGKTRDNISLKFDSQSSLILYTTPQQRLLRPQFPLSEVSGDGVEDLFCDCCGIQIDGDYSKCTDRETGFALCESILAGRFPESDEVRWVLLFNYGPLETESYFQRLRRILRLG
ncbi:hypothetical protein [Symmachiella dynata]|uniref:hypothetical protein n=1 Tax=Symmachiella dynata TaxID=2527995 RepID=UPI001189B4B7|nr:hypothetical protein [Symmachiella dynata]QDT51787.1 hypothetical protein Pan258_58800 [Symmachiella dynata]|tara:strand:- start:355 stop:822 length:468 start_codon:yes stop_codon:yes gene_type:complete